MPERALRLADVNEAGRHLYSLLTNEMLLLRHAAATHLRYGESVEDAIRRGDSEVALGILAQQRRNLATVIERTGPLIDGKHTDLHAMSAPSSDDGALARLRKQVQP